MKTFAAGFSEAQNAVEALESVAEQIGRQMNDQSCDLAILFLSERFSNARPKRVLELFQSRVAPKILIGCNASGVIGAKSEVEMKPAISALAMHLPGVDVTPFYVSPEDLEQINSGDDWARFIDLDPAVQQNFICLADPMTCDVSNLLRLFNAGYEHAPVIGGLSSANMAGVKSWLTVNGVIYPRGAVGVSVSGEVKFDMIVSQGCRPIGETYAITKAERNVVLELAGQPPLEALQELFQKLSKDDQELAQRALFVGLAADERTIEFKRGDFLIRNIMGADQASGAIAIGAVPEIGQTFQFQLRDARTSEDDLNLLLERLQHSERSGAAGGLLVSCCGRGKGLFGVPDHDVQIIQDKKGPMPLTGFFANGEFGPIDQVNHVHGYTSSFTIIR